MKLEVGMYVRTQYGYIAKLKKINKTDRYIEYEFNNKIGYDYDGFFHSIVGDCIDDIEIAKASHNIIDLIEEGDYVNGEKVLSVNEGNIKIGTGRDYMVFNNEKFIKSIVTKEQFESMSYEVGDK